MTNFERNKEKIKEVCKQKRIKYSLLCDWLNCQGCDHYEDPDYICVERALLWLSEDDGSPSPDRIAGRNEAWELAQRIAKDISIHAPLAGCDSKIRAIPQRYYQSFAKFFVSVQSCIQKHTKK